MIHIAICEDNDADMAHLRSLLCQTKILCDFTEYSNAEPMLLDMENGQKHFDLFLLDIFLPGQNGVETARRIRRLDEIHTQLASELFVRCHKSFIVNLLYVSKLTREGFYVGDTLIPISRTHAAGAKNIYYKRLFGVFQEY